MKQLIEYKLWAGQIPYFVADPLPGVFSGERHYGVSLDTDMSYLPDTVRVLTAGELADVVQGADLDPMDAEKRQQYLDDWLAKHGVGNGLG